RSRKRLGVGSDLKEGGGVDARRVTHPAHSVAARQQHLPVLDHRDRHPRHLKRFQGPVHLSVEIPGKTGLGRCRGRENDEGAAVPQRSHPTSTLEWTARRLRAYRAAVNARITSHPAAIPAAESSTSTAITSSSQARLECRAPCGSARWCS